MGLTLTERTTMRLLSRLLDLLRPRPHAERADVPPFGLLAPRFDGCDGDPFDSTPCARDCTPRIEVRNALDCGGLFCERSCCGPLVVGLAPTYTVTKLDPCGLPVTETYRDGVSGPVCRTQGCAPVSGATDGGNGPQEGAHGC